jgi:hypothetical protein
VHGASIGGVLRHGRSGGRRPGGGGGGTRAVHAGPPRAERGCGAGCHARRWGRRTALPRGAGQVPRPCGASKAGYLMSRRGCSLPANASGFDPHRASISSRSGQVCAALASVALAQLALGGALLGGVLSGGQPNGIGALLILSAGAAQPATRLTSRRPVVQNACPSARPSPSGRRGVCHSTDKTPLVIVVPPSRLPDTSARRAPTPGFSALFGVLLRRWVPFATSMFGLAADIVKKQRGLLVRFFCREAEPPVPASGLAAAAACMSTAAAGLTNRCVVWLPPLPCDPTANLVGRCRGPGGVAAPLGGGPRRCV